MSRTHRHPCAIFVFLGIAFAACVSSAQMPRQSLLVLSKQNHTLSIVDPATLKVLTSAPVGADPHEVVASQDGTKAYVSIYGGGAYHTINVIDLTQGKALAEIDTGALNGPHGLTFVGGKLWFTAEGAKAIARLDPASEKIEWVMGTGQDRTHMLYVTPNQKQIYTTNVASATVSVLEEKPMTFRPPPPPPGGGDGRQGPPPGPPPGVGMPRTTWEQTVIPVGSGDEGFDVTPDGRELWTANAEDGTLSVIDLAAKKVVATIPAGVNGANRLKFTLDGKYALISILGAGNDLIVYDVATRKEFKRVPIGRGAAGILIEPGGKRAFISCGRDNYVAVVDLTTWQVSSHIQAGDEPDGLAWAARQ